jgi:RNA polymerase sporulation-specific sigma factor
MDNVRNNEILALIEEYKRTASDDVFDAIVAAYTPLMSATAAKLSLELDRVRSEACFGLLKAVTTYDGTRGVTFGAYAKRCIYNHLCDLVRREAAHAPITDEVSVENIAVVDDIDSKLLHEEELETVGKFVRSVLSDFEYKVCILGIKGYKTADIADKLETSAKSVDNAKNRIATKLSREFSRRGGFN